MAARLAGAARAAAARRGASGASGALRASARPAVSPAAVRAASGALAARGAGPSAAVRRTGVRHAHTLASGEPGFVGSRKTGAEMHKDRAAKTGLPKPFAGLLSTLLGPDRSSASALARDDSARVPAKTVFRYDRRSPAEIRRAGGFKPKGGSLDFRGHQLGGARGDGEVSGFVSTSHDKAGAEAVRSETAHAGADGYFYELDAHPHDSFDLAAGLATDESYDNQREVAIAGPVDLGRVKAVTDSRTDKRTTFPPIGEGSA